MDMKLIEFSISRGRVVYINPELVVNVTPYGVGKCIVKYVNGQINVLVHSAEEVVSKLTADTVDDY